MTREEIVKIIIELIPSKTLKKEIVKSNFMLDDIDILYIIDNYCDIYYQKLKCLNNLINIIKDEKVLNYCKMIYQYEIKKYDDFVSNKRKHIFEAIPDADQVEYANMFFSKFEKASKYIEMCKEIETNAIIKKKYLDDQIPDFAYPSAGLQAKVIYGKNGILSVENYNVYLNFELWSYYYGFDICDYPKKGIISGHYRTNISNIFKEGDKAKVEKDGKMYI